MKRANFYIDGFNLYFGMLSAGYSDCKWLDIGALAERLKNKNHLVGSVKFFTSRVKNNSQKQARQNRYLEALESTNVEIIYGQFLSQKSVCNHCKKTNVENKEKMTDVNIATTIIKDAFTDRFDVAFLISADSDLVPPLKLIKEIFPEKKLIVVFPPSRRSYELQTEAHSSFILGHKKLRECQLPYEVVTKSGVIILKPKEWS